MYRRNSIPAYALRRKPAFIERKLKAYQNEGSETQIGENPVLTENIACDTDNEMNIEIRKDEPMLKNAEASFPNEASIDSQASRSGFFFGGFIIPIIIIIAIIIIFSVVRSDK